MQIGIVTNLLERKGLWRDGLVLESCLKELGHIPTLIHYTHGECKVYDLIIHCEVISEFHLGMSKRHWWIPNCDWVLDEYLELAPRMEKILCKTHYAEKVFKPRFSQSVYTGFMSEDHYDSSVKRERLFFHTCKGNVVKGTDAIRDSKVPCIIADGMSEEELVYNQNKCQFHLHPSQREGFGQSLFESLSCGAIVIGTNIAPINEYGIPYLLEPYYRDTMRLAECGVVSGGVIAEVAGKCMKLSDKEIDELSWKARKLYLDKVKEFKANLRTTLNSEI